MMDSESDDLVFYTDYGADCVRGYFEVLTEPEEESDSSVLWIAKMNVAGREIGELRVQCYPDSADNEDRLIFGTMMKCRVGDRVNLEGQISEKLLIVDDIASDNPYDTATREYPADPEYWEVYPGTEEH